MIAKPKPWMPVLKEKERYIVFTADCDRMQIEQAVVRALGILGSAQADYRLIGLKDGKGIVRTNSRSVEKVISALTLSEKPVFRVYKVSGTLKKAKTNARNL